LGAPVGFIPWWEKIRTRIWRLDFLYYIYYSYLHVPCVSLNNQGSNSSQDWNCATTGEKVADKFLHLIQIGLKYIVIYDGIRARSSHKRISVSKILHFNVDYNLLKKTCFFKNLPTVFILNFSKSCTLLNRPYKVLKFIYLIHLT